MAEQILQIVKENLAYLGPPAGPEPRCRRWRVSTVRAPPTDA
jgi:hypothetical protein